MEPLLHKYMQTFPEPLESEYREYRNYDDRPVVDKVLPAIALGLALVLGIGWVAIGMRTIALPSLLSQMFLVAMISAIALLARFKRFVPYFDLFGVLAYVGTAVCFSVILATTTRVTLAGYLFVGGIVVLGATPHVFKVHATALGTFTAGFLGAALYRGAIREEGFNVIVLFYVFTAVVVSVSWRSLDRARRLAWLAQREIAREKEWSATLLASIVPPRFTAELREQRAVRRAIVESHVDVAVVFVDLVGFTPLAASLPPDELVCLLNDLFSRFDAVAERAGAEKIKTIGDAYMAAAGLRPGMRDPVVVAAETAIEIRDCVTRYSLLTGHDLQVRIGLHCGPVVAGVLGTSRLHFDLWGETVNVAARLEAHGVAGAIHVSGHAAMRLKSRYALESRGYTSLKGVGEVETFLLESSSNTRLPAQENPDSPGRRTRARA